MWRYLVVFCLLIALALVASSSPDLTDRATSILAVAMPTGYAAKTPAALTPAALTPAAAGKPVPTPTLAPQFLVVANTDGDGVALRKEPGSTEIVSAWQDGARMVVVGPDQQAGGRVWRNVRDANGNVGWVPSEYLAPLTATPGPKVTPTVGPSASEVVVMGNRSLAVDDLRFQPQIGSTRPEQGREYVVVTITVKNVGDKRESYTPYDFRLQNGQGNITGSRSITGVGNPLENGQLAPGGRVNGRLVFEIPQGDRDLSLLWTSCTVLCDEREIKLK